MMQVLLIEDDESFRTTLALALKRRGCEVHQAANATVAMNEARAAQPQGIVLDMRLGSSSGMALISELRQLLPEARLIVLTGYGSIPSALEAVRLGADDYLLKPASADQVLAALEGHEGASGVPQRVICPAWPGSNGSTSSVCCMTAAATSRMPPQRSASTAATCSASSASSRQAENFVLRTQGALTSFKLRMLYIFASSPSAFTASSRVIRALVAMISSLGRPPFSARVILTLCTSGSFFIAASTLLVQWMHMMPATSPW